MSSQLLAMSLGLEIFLLILFLLAVIAASFFLFLGIRKDHKRYKYSRYKIKDCKRADFEALLKERIEGENPKPFSLIFVEVNAAKEYRDNYGEEHYAWALGAIRERISVVLPKDSKVCLYDYDTYAFLLEGEYSVEQLNEYSAQCISKVHLPVRCGLRKKIESPDLILGAAAFHAKDTIKTGDFLRNVDLALAVSGRGGVNDFIVYTPDLEAKKSDYHYYRELKDAINANEFTLCFQPIRNLFNGNTVAFESMLCWNHNELGALRPEKFIHVMERSGDIQWVGLWAYEQMLIAYKKYLKAHPNSEIVFSMNLTHRQLLDTTISDELFKMAEKYRVPTYRICFEVGETAILGRDLVARENIEKLSQCGFLMAIDNFMVDESTVTRIGLKKIYHWVKLDKRFTAAVQGGTPDIKNMQKLLEFARAENVAVIAQDIKDSITEEFIKRIGIFCGQGSCLGKAEPIEKYLQQSETVVVIKKSEPKASSASEERAG